MLTDNRFGEKGTLALAECLEHNTSLTNLVVDTPTRDMARKSLSILVAKNAQLQHYKKLAAELKGENKQLRTQLAKLQGSK